MSRTCDVLLEMVLELSGSSSSYRRQLADEALEKMGELGCEEELRILTTLFAESPTPHQRRLSERALELLPES